jgi:hypothetical protein
MRRRRLTENKRTKERTRNEAQQDGNRNNPPDSQHHRRRGVSRNRHQGVQTLNRRSDNRGRLRPENRKKRYQAGWRFVGVRGTPRRLAVAASEQETSGLGNTSRASAVLSFQRRNLAWNDSAENTRLSTGPRLGRFPVGVPLATPDAAGEKRTKLVVRAVRVGRGASGLGRAVLEYQQPAAGQAGGPGAGLTMIPLAPEFPEGDPISETTGHALAPVIPTLRVGSWGGFVVLWCRSGYRVVR